MSGRWRAGVSSGSVSLRGEVLVALMPTVADMALAREQHWYRIPVTSAAKWLKNSWPPRWIAFYQPKVFGFEAFTVRYFAEVLELREALRVQLFPAAPDHPHAAWRYHQLILGPLQDLAVPIRSHRLRRIVFIPTNWQKFVTATEINDLFDESPLEDRLWSEFRRLGILAERQQFVKVDGHNYALDFAVYCNEGKLDVETDGDGWHEDPFSVVHDLQRDVRLEAADWSLLRFNSGQINEEMESYCLPNVIQQINTLGGLDTRGSAPRKRS